MHEASDDDAVDVTVMTKKTTPPPVTPSPIPSMQNTIINTVNDTVEEVGTMAATAMRAARRAVRPKTAGIALIGIVFVMTVLTDGVDVDGDGGQVCCKLVSTDLLL